MLLTHDRKCSNCHTSGDEWIERPCGYPDHEVTDVQELVTDLMIPDAVLRGLVSFREYEASDGDEASSEIIANTDGRVTFRYFYGGGSAAVTVYLPEAEDGDIDDACRVARRNAKKACPY